MSQRRSRLIFHAGNLDTRECAAKDGFHLASRRTCCWRSVFSWCSGEGDSKNTWRWLILDCIRTHFYEVWAWEALASLRRSRPFTRTVFLDNFCDSIRQQNVWWIEIHLRGLLLDLNIESFFTVRSGNIFKRKLLFWTWVTFAARWRSLSRGNFIRSPSHIYYRQQEKKWKNNFKVDIFPSSVLKAKRAIEQSGQIDENALRIAVSKPGPLINVVKINWVKRKVEEKKKNSI